MHSRTFTRRVYLRTLSSLAIALSLASCNAPPATTATALPDAPEIGTGYRTGMVTQHATRHMAA
ncbi:gamma-glutamyltransferase, partial [Pseudomonas gingeri]|nr:gamma-glutamyltransferase [Pseudomonas gingeri]